jgi:tetratricopeptide (TPR) repeat protein
VFSGEVPVPRSAFFIVSAVSILAAVSSHAIKVNKVELKLAVALADDAPAYSGTSEQEQIFLYAGDTAIVHPHETSGPTADWYYVDEICSYEHYNNRYFKAGTKLEIRSLEGAVAADKVNVREYPSTDAKVETTLYGGSIVTVLARTREREKLEGFYGSYYWYEVKTSEGVLGWIYGALLGILRPSEAYDFALAAFERNDPDAVIRVVGPTYVRFPDSSFYRWSYTYDEPYFEFGPTFNLLTGYAFYLKGNAETARYYYYSTLTFGDKPARTTFKIFDADTGGSLYKDCEYGAATLARVGLGLTYVRSYPEEAAGYFAHAIADSESGISTENVRPEYFDALLVRNLIAMYEAGKVTGECLETVGALLPSECSYDFAPAYFLLNYGEALERDGNSSEAVVLYKRIVDDYPGAYIYRGGNHTGYWYMDISGRALWRVMRIQTRLGENRDFDAYCDRVAKASDDKRIGFIAYYLAGIALDKAGDAAGASKQYNRAERYYQAGDLGTGDFGFYYDDLYRLLIDRMTGHPYTDAEEWQFKGYLDEA